MVPLLTITDNDCDPTFEALFNGAELNHDPEVRYDIGGGGGGGGGNRISRYINGPPWWPKGVGAGGGCAPSLAKA